MEAINKMIFDNEVVNAIKQRKLNRETLYNLLYSGKITMKEYLSVLS